MRSDMKYVVFSGHNGEQIVIFPKIIQHSVMADDIKKSSFGGMRPIAGGFIIDGQCVGESESLRMKSRGDKDTELIAKLLDINEFSKVKFTQTIHVDAISISKNKAKRLRKKGRN